MSLVKVGHLGPSLAVQFYEKWCIAGYGPYIYTFDYKNGEEINRCQMFRRNKVHGISMCKGKVLAYGGRSVSVVDFERVLRCDELLGDEKVSPEWVISGMVRRDGTGCYVLTSYNRVMSIALNGNVEKTSAVGGERSLLYAGTVHESGGRVYVVAGTVMNGIVVWDLEQRRVLHRLVDHEGSIFNVTINEEATMLASCSDDRSVKVWDLHSGALLSTGWGHTARIWGLRFFDGGRKLVSVSEDCTCRVWEVGCGQLTEGQVFNVHLMKNVWGVDVQEEEMLLATSGNDGRIIVTTLQSENREADFFGSYSLDELNSSGIAIMQGEIVKGIFWFGFGMIAATSEGQVLRYCADTGEWSLLFRWPKTTKGYLVMDGSTELNVLAILNNSCDLLVLRFSCAGELQVREEVRLDRLSKTRDCLVAAHGTSVYVCVESPNPLDPLLCLNIDSETLNTVQEVGFKKPEHFVSNSLCSYGNHIIVGSRFSTIAVFDLNNPGYEFVIRDLTPGDSVSSIANIEGSKFIVTNREGYYSVVSLVFEERSYQTLHSNLVSKGFLEGGNFDRNGDFIIHGFKSNKFYIFNETKQVELGSQLCGGAHRQWRFFSGDDFYVLCFIKASRIHIKKFHKGHLARVLKCGTHGREIRDVSIRSGKMFGHGYLYVTASEDTTVALNHFNPATGEHRNYWTQRGHISGLQKCKFISDTYVLSSSAKEELFLWEVSDSSTTPFMKLKKKLPVSSSNPEVRIMDFSQLFTEHAGNFFLATVYSDSTIRIWHYNSKHNDFELILQDGYTTSCILNVSLQIFCDRIILLIAPTDGFLTLWDVTDSLSLAKTLADVAKQPALSLPNNPLKFRVHKSGIKAMDTRINKTELTVFTGGDDGAIGISTIVLSRPGSLVLSASEFKTDAAVSTITSMHLIDNDTKLLTTSVDQILRLWSVSNGPLTLLEKRYTTVADTCCSAVLNSPNTVSLLVAGTGLSTWTLDTNT